MAEILRLLLQLPHSLYTLATFALIFGGVLFLRSSIRQTRPDRLARMLIGIVLVTMGIGWYCFLMGLILR